MKPLIIGLIWLVGVTAKSVEVLEDKATPSKSSEPAEETVKEKRYAVHDSHSYLHSPTPCPPSYPHYHPPMPEIHYPKPVYGPPIHPKPVYVQPVHPKPVYVQPVHPKPVYGVPEYHKPVYKLPEYPKPVYGPPMHHHHPVQLIHQPVYQSYVPKQTVSYVKPHYPVHKPDYHYLPAKPHFAYAPAYHPMKHEYSHEYNIHQTYHTPSHYVSKPGIVYKEHHDCKPCYQHHEPQVVHAPPAYVKPEVHYLPTHSHVSPVIKPLLHHAPCP